MSIATIEIQPRVENIDLTNETLTVHLDDGRIVSAPLAWYPRLYNGTTQERSDWRVFQDSEERDIIFWERLDELIPVVALLTGTPSRESKRSLNRWRAERKSASD